MPRPESALGPGRPEVAELAAGLRRLRDKAGAPAYRELAHARETAARRNLRAGKQRG